MAEGHTHYTPKYEKLALNWEGAVISEPYWVRDSIDRTYKGIYYGNQEERRTRTLLGEVAIFGPESPLAGSVFICEYRQTLGNIGDYELGVGTQPWTDVFIMARDSGNILKTELKAIYPKREVVTIVNGIGFSSVDNALSWLEARRQRKDDLRLLSFTYENMIRQIDQEMG